MCSSDLNGAASRGALADAGADGAETDSETSSHNGRSRGEGIHGGKNEWAPGKRRENPGGVGGRRCRSGRGRTGRLDISRRRRARIEPDLRGAEFARAPRGGGEIDQ